MNYEQKTDGTENVLVIGLTGQTGAGKTTVSQIFAEQGFEILNADLIARRVVEPQMPCLAELCDCFGTEILNPDGTMNRRRVAEIVFSDQCKNEILGSIMFPYITKEILSEIRRCAQEGKHQILLDAPTLFESHSDDFCQIVLSVLADPSIRKARIIARDSMTPQEAEKRMNAQLSEEYFKTHSDFVIYNNENAASLRAVTLEVIDKIQEIHQEHISFCMS